MPPPPSTYLRFSRPVTFPRPRLNIYLSPAIPGRAGKEGRSLSFRPRHPHPHLAAAAWRLGVGGWLTSRSSRHRRVGRAPAWSPARSYKSRPRPSAAAAEAAARDDGLVGEADAAGPTPHLTFPVPTHARGAHVTPASIPLGVGQFRPSPSA